MVALRQLYTLTLALLTLKMLESIYKMADIDRQFQTRQLSDLANGKVTHLRPDQILIQNQNFWIFIGSVLALATLREIWMRFRKSEPDLGDSRLD